MPKVEIYTSTHCAYCNAAKNILKDKGVEFEEIDLTDNYARRLMLVQKHKWRTVPMIVVDDQLIGGYYELLILENKGELDRLLKNEE